MSDLSSSPEAVPQEMPPGEAPKDTPVKASSPISEPAPSYVKLAMRNMVKKGGTSLYHFCLTVVGLLALLVGLAYLTR